MKVMIIFLMLFASQVSASGRAVTLGDDLPWPLWDPCSLEFKEILGVWSVRTLLVKQYYEFSNDGSQINEGGKRQMITVRQLNARLEPILQGRSMVKSSKNGIWIPSGPATERKISQKPTHIIGLRSFEHPETKECSIHVLAVRSMDKKQWVLHNVKRVYSSPWEDEDFDEFIDESTQLDESEDL